LAPQGLNPAQTVSQPAANLGVEAALRQFAGHVLVAEDNPTNQMLIQTLLGKHGLQVTLAGDGRQALEAIKALHPVAPFDLVLMDLQMPVMDGCSATRHLRAWEAQTGRPRLPVVALTAGAFEEDRQHCLDAGMDDVLTKPVAMDQLQAALAHWVGCHPATVQAQDSTPVPVYKPVDVAHVRTLLLEIMPLLAHSKFASIACLRQVQDALAGTALEDEVTQIARLLQEFRFDRVQQRLRQLAAQQGWEINQPFTQQLHE
jgi:CheY-like chemotaxis protein